MYCILKLFVLVLKKYMFIFLAKYFTLTAKRGSSTAHLPRWSCFKYLTGNIKWANLGSYWPHWEDYYKCQNSFIFCKWWTDGAYSTHYTLLSTNKFIRHYHRVLLTIKINDQFNKFHTMTEEVLEKGEESIWHVVAVWMQNTL